MGDAPEELPWGLDAKKLQKVDLRAGMRAGQGGRGIAQRSALPPPRARHAPRVSVSAARRARARARRGGRAARRALPRVPDTACPGACAGSSWRGRVLASAPHWGAAAEGARACPVAGGRAPRAESPATRSRASRLAPRSAVALHARGTSVCGRLRRVAARCVRSEAHAKYDARALRSTPPQTKSKFQKHKEEQEAKKRAEEQEAVSLSLLTHSRPTFRARAARLSRHGAVRAPVTRRLVRDQRRSLCRPKCLKTLWPPLRAMGGNRGKRCSSSDAVHSPSILSPPLLLSSSLLLLYMESPPYLAAWCFSSSVHPCASMHAHTHTHACV